jgi:serine-type D-Ala-D-Ala carboxypeptidase (penicillin-binding protein 5/6)
MTYSEPARTTTRRSPGPLVGGPLVVLVAIAAYLGYQSLASSSSTRASPPDVLRSEQRGAAGEALPNTVWPAAGQAAVQTGQSPIQAGPNQHPAPIASLAKVMTAYLVLRDHPLQPGEDGPTITLTDDDVADTDRRRRQQESVVPIAAGEQLTERQALQALLLPSANNIAAVVARWDAGSGDRFVARMNATARSLGMTHTRYTDPSGYDDATVSTAADQVRIVARAMRLPVFPSIVATQSATLPVAGTVHNTNTLLGRKGFVGVKTGSTTAAGGCLAFRAIRWIDGKQTTITGVVLGQPGHNRIAAGLAAADAMVDRIAGPSQRRVPTMPGLQQRAPASRNCVPKPSITAARPCTPSSRSAPHSPHAEDPCDEAAHRRPASDGSGARWALRRRASSADVSSPLSAASPRRWAAITSGTWLKA